MAVAAAGELRIVSPATLEVVGSVSTVAPEAVQELVAEARLAQERFGEAPLQERRALLVRLADVVLGRADEIADTIVAETAKPRVEAFATELFPALDALAWLGRNVTKLLGPERVPYPQLHLRHKRARVHYEPSVSSVRSRPGTFRLRSRSRRLRSPWRPGTPWCSSRPS